MKSLRLSEGWDQDSGKGSASIHSGAQSQNSHSSHVNGAHTSNGNAMRMTTTLTTNGAATTTVADKNAATSVVPAAKESTANGSINHGPNNQNGSMSQLTRHDLNDTHRNTYSTLGLKVRLAPIGYCYTNSYPQIRKIKE